MRATCLLRLSKIVAAIGLSVSVTFTKAHGEESKPVAVEIVPRAPDAPVAFQLAVYLPANGKLAPRELALDIIKGKQKGLRVVEDFPSPKELKAPSVKIEIVESKTYAPPDSESLRYFGRGLDKQQGEQLQESKTALVLTFFHQREVAWPALKVAYELLEAIARKTDGLIWDDETRLVFTPDAWHETVLSSSEATPCISDHIAIHSYRTGDYVRAITLGMSKFGLPDVVVQEFPGSSNRSIGNLINVFCQALVEGGEFRCPGKFDLDLKSVKNEESREAQLGKLKENAQAVAQLELRLGKPEEGDPDNDLIELGFDRYDGPDVFSRQQLLLTELFGASDSIVNVDHNEKILEASKRAKAKLPKLKKAFDAGLRPGEYLLVKAPFKVPQGGNEWMWVEVINWKDGEISGSLQNDPHDIPDLKAGQSVTVSQKEIFDYLLVLPDGSQEGNETGKAIEESLK